jgi:hypothetical protein
MLAGFWAAPYFSHRLKNQQAAMSSDPKKPKRRKPRRLRGTLGDRVDVFIAKTGISRPTVYRHDGNRKAPVRAGGRAHPPHSHQ